MTVTHARMLDKRVGITRKTSAGDGMGGRTTAWPNVETNVKARIDPMPERRRIEYQKMGYPVSHSIVMPGGTDVRGGDRITYGSRIFEVKGTPKDPGEQGRLLEILADEMGV